MNKVYLASKIQTDSILDGDGLRSVIWFQGCSHNCEGCHNPETHKFNIGLELELEDVYKMIDELENQDGITFSGGDPMFQPEAFLEILKYVKEKGYNVWCYTGFLYEDLLKLRPIYKEILSYIDVLVDGPFILSEKSYSVKYRGSKNQRLIDIPKTLKTGKVVKYAD